MEQLNYAYETYPTAGQAEAAVDALLVSNFGAGNITVLFPENADSRNFANRWGTIIPAGTAEPKTADLPLDGELGIEHPANGPREGALQQAMAAMGVPADRAYKIVDGKEILLSVLCDDAEAAERAKRVLESREPDNAESLS